MDTRRIETYLALQTMLVAAGLLVLVSSSDAGGFWLFLVGVVFPGLVFAGVAGHRFVELLKTETPTAARDHGEVESE